MVIFIFIFTLLSLAALNKEMDHGSACLSLWIVLYDVCAREMDVSISILFHFLWQCYTYPDPLSHICFQFGK